MKGAVMDLERKFARLTEATVAEGAGAVVVAGHASLWDEADGSGDVVERGAFAASLRELARRGERVRMLWQHDPSQPIGLWDEVREDQAGLLVRGRILTDVARGREAAALVRAGAIDGLSIGYRTVRATKDAGGRRRLAQVDLWEVSLVTFPMLREARVSAKAAGPLDDLRAAIALARTRLRT